MKKEKGLRFIFQFFLWKKGDAVPADHASMPKMSQSCSNRNPNSMGFRIVNVSKMDQKIELQEECTVNVVAPKFPGNFISKTISRAQDSCLFATAKRPKEIPEIDVSPPFKNAVHFLSQNRVTIGK